MLIVSRRGSRHRPKTVVQISPDVPESSCLGLHSARYVGWAGWSESRGKPPGRTPGAGARVRRCCRFAKQSQFPRAMAPGRAGVAVLRNKANFDGRWRRGAPVFVVLRNKANFDGRGRRSAPELAVLRNKANFDGAMMLRCADVEGGRSASGFCANLCMFFDSFATSAAGAHFARVYFQVDMRRGSRSAAARLCG